VVDFASLRYFAADPSTCLQRILNIAAVTVENHPSSVHWPSLSSTACLHQLVLCPESLHKVQGRTGSQGQSRQQAYNLYNKLILALTLTITDTGGADLTLMLGYQKFKTQIGPITLTLPCGPVPFAVTDCSFTRGAPWQTTR